MSNSAWCDLNSKGDIIQLQDKCPNPKCSCEKPITFIPRQYMLEGTSVKSKIKSIFRGPKTAWNKFYKLAVKVAAPFFGMAVGAKTKN